MSTSNQPRRALLLTGASRGIGHATVKRFSSAGWRVITCSRHAFPEECPWEMGPEDHIQVDLADHASTSAAIEEIKNRLDGGLLHALVNNAAISPKAEGGTRLSSVDTTIDVWEHVFSVNFFAPIMLARGLMDQLAAAHGSVVNVTSIAGSRVHPFAGAAYSTSKAALAALTREMASDFGSRGIRVNSIAPGEIDTAILSPGTEKIVEQIPMQRLGTPDEVAKIIYVLCTETSSYVNGAEIHINGGSTCERQNHPLASIATMAPTNCAAMNGRDAAWRDAGEGVRQRARDGHGRIGEGCRGGEPIGGRDVKTDGVGHGGGAERAAAENRQHQAERRDAFRDPLSPSEPDRGRDLEQGHVEHGMREQDAGNAADNLRRAV
jgi:NAD(P)-dependent dehydrogenase (short-subunit alcohol dehydrogenase family)